MLRRAIHIAHWPPRLSCRGSFACFREPPAAIGKVGIWQQPVQGGRAGCPHLVRQAWGFAASLVTTAPSGRSLWCNPHREVRCWQSRWPTLRLPLRLCHGQLVGHQCSRCDSTTGGSLLNPSFIVCTVGHMTLCRMVLRRRAACGFTPFFVLCPSFLPLCTRTLWHTPSWRGGDGHRGV